MGLGSRLKDLLSERKMTIKELSEKTGISINTLYSITKRDSNNVRTDTLEKIASALNVKLEALITPDYAKAELHNLLNDIKNREKDYRQKLSVLGEMLNLEGLSLLLTYAIELLENEDYRSENFR